MKCLLVTCFVALAHGGPTCTDDAFPKDFNGKQVGGLTGNSKADDVASCRQACCDQGPSCEMYEFSEHPSRMPKCWMGKIGSGASWLSHVDVTNCIT